MSKDRSMATGPYPTRVTTRPVTLERWVSGGYDQRIVGRHILIHMSDDTTVPCCTSPNGHKTQRTLVACATAKVAKLNDAAGIPEDAR